MEHIRPLSRSAYERWATVDRPAPKNDPLPPDTIWEKVGYILFVTFIILAVPLWPLWVLLMIPVVCDASRSTRR